MERYQFDKEDPIINFAQRVTLRKGSLVVWNSKLPHCSYPNDGEEPRMVQYIQYARRNDPAVRPVRFGVPQKGPWGPWELTIDLPKEFELTDLARKVYGIGIVHDDEVSVEPEEEVANNTTQSWRCYII